MANKKITQLSEMVETDINSADVFHIIDDPLGNPINKKVRVDSLRANTFSNIPNPLNISGLLNLSQPPEILTTTSGGIIGIDTTITHLAMTATSTQTFILDDGTEGQLKFIVMTSINGSNAEITPDNLLGHSTLTFNNVGDSVLLLFTGGNWTIISNNGVTIT